MSLAISYSNLLDDATPINYSSQQTNFPASNVIEPFRSKAWRSALAQIEDQYLEFDLGYQARPKTAILINEQRGILLSQQATIKVIGSNDGNWTTPEVEVVIPWDENFISKFDDSAFGSCRFYRFFFDDPNQVDGYLEVGNLFLGESVQFTSSDVALNWDDTKLDDSDEIESDGGEPWFDTKTQRDRWTFELPLMNKTDKDNLVEIFKTVGRHKPFYLHLDPGLEISSTQSELARYVRFINDLSVVNVFNDAYNVRISVKEAI